MISVTKHAHLYRVATSSAAIFFHTLKIEPSLLTPGKPFALIGEGNSTLWLEDIELTYFLLQYIRLSCTTMHSVEHMAEGFWGKVNCV